MALIALAVAVCFDGGAGQGGVDDALTTLVYARHLAQRGAFFWNLADGVVDGCTSILDVVLKAALVHLLGADPLRIAWWCAALFLCALGCAAAFFVRAHSSSRHRDLAALVVGLAVVANPAALEGANFLLEGPMFLFLAVAVLMLAFGRSPPLPALGVLLVLTMLARPEGVPWSFAVLAFFASERRARLPRGRLGLLVVGVVAAWLGYFVWHRLHFGEWAPNTYFAKSSEHRMDEIRDGLSYLAGSPSALLLLLAPAFLVCRFKDPSARRRYLFLVALAAMAAGVVVLEGGDSYAESARFLGLAEVTAIIAFAYGAATANLRWGSIPQVALAALMAVELASQVQSWQVKRVFLAAGARPLTERSFELDRFIGDWFASFGSGTRVAESDMQELKYFADALEVIDLSGLNNREVAHAPWQGPVTYGKFRFGDLIRYRPEFAVLGFTWLKKRPAATEPLEQVLTDDKRMRFFFPLNFDGVSLPAEADRAALTDLFDTASLPLCGGYVFNFLVRKDVAPRAAAAGAWIDGLSTEDSALEKLRGDRLETLCRRFDRQYFYFIYQAIGLRPWPATELFIPSTAPSMGASSSRSPAS